MRWLILLLTFTLACSEPVVEPPPDAGLLKGPDAALPASPDAALPGPDAAHPGLKGEQCSDTAPCASTLGCLEGVCRAVGGLDQPCRGNSCDPGLECVSGTCLEEVPVAKLTAKGESEAVALAWTWSWGKAGAAPSFELVRRREGEDVFAPLATVAGSSYLDEDLELGVSYEYAVTVKVGERTSLPSAPVLASATRAPKEWTLIYFISSDGDYGYTYWFNIDGLEGQGGTTAKVSAVALYDGFAKGDTKYLEIGGSPSQTVATRPPRAADGEVNMGDPKAYTDFLDWLLPRHSARRYLLSFHDHGGGAVEPLRDARNMLYDQSSGDSLDPDEQAQVVAYLAKKTGRKVDVVESMTCLGQMIENTWGMRDAARYHVGAESLSYVTSTFPLRFLAGRPEATAREVARFLAEDHAAGVEAMDAPCTWSAIDLSRLAELGDALRALAADLSAFAVDDAHKALVRAVAARAQSFTYQPKDLMSAYLDLKDLAAVVAAEPGLPASARATAERIVGLFETGGLVEFNAVHSGTHPQTTITVDYSRAFGLSVYHPNDANPFYVTKASPPYAQLSFPAQTGWAAYLQQVSLPAPSGKCAAVTNLTATRGADGKVTVSWDHAPNQQGCDAFYCSRDLAGKFTGQYQTVGRSGDQGSFVVTDEPTAAGTYTWRVTAFRGSDEASINWTRSAPVVVPE